MKKFFIAALAVLGLSAKAQAAPLYGYVQITTTTSLTPTLQNGSIKIASGTIKSLTVTNGISVSTISVSTLTVAALTVTNAMSASSATVTNTVTAGTFSGSGASLTNIPGANVTGTIPAAPLSNAILLQNTLQTGATFFVSSGTATNFTASASTSTNITFTTGTGTTLVVTTITPTGIVGTATNDSANPSNYGYYISTKTAAATNFPTSGQFGDLISTGVPGGDWDCTATMEAMPNGATVTTITIGLSSNSGNSATGLTSGDNRFSAQPPTSASSSSLFVPAYRISQTSLTTWYLKYAGSFSVATPQATGRISCRRAR